MIFGVGTGGRMESLDESELTEDPDGEDGSSMVGATAGIVSSEEPSPAQWDCFPSGFGLPLTRVSTTGAGVRSLQGSLSAVGSLSTRGMHLPSLVEGASTVVAAVGVLVTVAT